MKEKGMETCDWNMVLTIIGTNIGVIALVGGFILWGLSKLDGDIKQLSAKIDCQTQRTDQLYMMFIDLLKARKDP